MPEEYDFKRATTKDVFNFLTRAAKDRAFRKVLEKGRPEAVSAALSKYGVDVPADQIPPVGKRRVPSPMQCRLLIATFELPYEETEYDYASSTLAALIMVEGHAMPLVVTVEDEVAAAG
jgi:hypothetical protein